MKLVRSFAVAITFLTRLPVPSRDIRPGDLGRAIAFFPLVGGFLGLALIGGVEAASGRLSTALTAIGLLALQAALTGALHLDGLADVFDGLGAGRHNRERMLQIMRDSRIGAMGAVSLVLVLLGKLFALIELLQAGRWWAFFAGPAMARWAVVPLLLAFPYARQEGLGKTFHAEGKPIHFAAATLFAVCMSLPIGLRIAFPTAIAWLVALIVGAGLYRKLGGLTGDVYGAAIELSELAFWIAATGASSAN